MPTATKDEDHIIRQAIEIFDRMYYDEYNHLEDCVRTAVRYAVDEACREMY